LQYKNKTNNILEHRRQRVTAAKDNEVQRLQNLKDIPDGK
jgi:hypothetical protein